MVSRLRHFPLSEDLRAEFQYNNLMYLAAGYLAEHLTGSTWEELVQRRLLGPLGMGRANFSVAATQKDRDHARPYRRQGGKVVEIPFRDLTAIGPAGSINASVREMARWVMLHLQGGEVDGTRLLAREAIADLHTVRMPMPSARPNPELIGVGYASGWMVDVYRGHRRVHHGGNIDGFSAMVTLLPDAGFGFCVLTNLDACGMHEMVVRQLTDRLLGLEPKDWKSEALSRRKQADGMEQKGKEGARAERRTGTSPSHPLAEYAGDYEHPGYGRGRIELRDGVLRADFHGLGGRLEHWHFDVFAYGDDADSPELAGMKLMFTTDFEGEIDALRVVLEPSTPAIVFARQPDARLRDAAFLRTLVGDYDLGTMVATIALQGEGLVLTLPGQRHELEPGRGLVFSMHGLSGYSVRFVADAAGKVTGLRVRQPEGVFEAVRKP
ncbi:MAG: serine hydrolase [Planctomycetes bacterium]|nr:serine hydrolase [Planctomycetota bacterium]